MRDGHRLRRLGLEERAHLAEVAALLLETLQL
jgi:hypothetical protein